MSVSRRGQPSTMATSDRYRLFEVIVTSDPEDHAVGVAHGFPADHGDFEEPCRNGCGVTFGELVANKQLGCPAPAHAATAEVEAAEAALWAEFRGRLRWM